MALVAQLFCAAYNTFYIALNFTLTKQANKDRKQYKAYDPFFLG